MRLLVLAATSLLCLSPVFAQTNFSFTNHPTEDGYIVSVTLADFDRDGYPDIAAVQNPVEGGTNVVNIYLNDHQGEFGSPTSYPSSGTGSILAVDVNGDKWPDLVTSSGNSVLLNNRNGTFHTGTAVVTQKRVSSFVGGDFNKDGKVDLAAVEGVLGFPSQIEILLNNGAGTFTSKQILALSSGTENAVAADFDGDGNLDLSNTASGRTLVWWGKGNGTFAVPLKIFPPSGFGAGAVASGDFNNDGLPDLAVTSNDNSGCPDEGQPCGTTSAYVYKNLGGRKFQLGSSFFVTGNQGAVLYPADINRDLNVDLVDLYSAGGVHDGDIGFLLGNGNNTFGERQGITNSSVMELAFRDLNRDSRQDVVMASFFPGGDVFVGLASDGFTNCPGTSSASLGAKICAPANNANVSSSFLVKAAGDSPLGVQRLELWVDGTKAYQKLGDQMNKRVTLTRGRHRIAVVAVDKYVGSSSTVEYVNVQ